MTSHFKRIKAIAEVYRLKSARLSIPKTTTTTTLSSSLIREGKTITGHKHIVEHFNNFLTSFSINLQKKVQCNKKHSSSFLKNLNKPFLLHLLWQKK